MASDWRWCLSAWRILLRALPVVTKLSQAGFGRAPGAVMISTVWPLPRGSDSGARRRLMRQALQLLPTPVRYAYAAIPDVGYRCSFMKLHLPVLLLTSPHHRCTLMSGGKLIDDHAVLALLI